MLEIDHKYHISNNICIKVILDISFNSWIKSVLVNSRHINLKKGILVGIT